MAEQSRLSVIGWFIRAFAAGFGTVLGLFCGAGVIGGILFLVTFGAPQLVQEELDEYVARPIGSDELTPPDYGLHVEFAPPPAIPLSAPTPYPSSLPDEIGVPAPSPPDISLPNPLQSALLPSPPEQSAARRPDPGLQVQEAAPVVPVEEPPSPVPPSVEVIEVE